MLSMELEGRLCTVGVIFWSMTTLALASSGKSCHQQIRFLAGGE